MSAMNRIFATFALLSTGLLVGCSEEPTLSTEHSNDTVTEVTKLEPEVIVDRNAPPKDASVPEVMDSADTLEKKTRHSSIEQTVQGVDLPARYRLPDPALTARLAEEEEVMGEMISRYDAAMHDSSEQQAIQEEFAAASQSYRVDVLSKVKQDLQQMHRAKPVSHPYN